MGTFHLLTQRATAINFIILRILYSVVDIKMSQEYIFVVMPIWLIEKYMRCMESNDKEEYSHISEKCPSKILNGHSA